MKKKPTKIREDFAIKRASDYLAHYGLTEPPVNSIKEIKRFGKFKWNKDIPGEGFALYREEKKKYLIVLNPEQIKGRKNWTGSHELGHICLYHCIEFDCSSLNKAEEGILDREADIFARELLMPSEWVWDKFERPISVPRIGKMVNLFDVSWDAMIRRMVELEICTKKEIQALFEFYYNSPKTNEPNHCLEYYNSNFYRRVVSMDDFVFPSMNNNQRYMFCPKCNNNVFSKEAQHCKKCGHYLFNVCGNDPGSNLEYYCGKQNISDALFCEYCGSMTSMGELIKSMKEQEEREAAASEDPFADDRSDIDISDSDLPF